MGVIVVTIVIVSAISFYSYVNPFKQYISVNVVDLDGNPVSNVSVEGLILTPPNKGLYFQPVFLTHTDTQGIATVYNLSVIKNIYNEWLKYYNWNLSRLYFLPTILIFLTYEYKGNLYFQQSNFCINVSDFLNGESYSSTIVVNPDRNNLLVDESNVNSSTQLNSFNLKNYVENISDIAGGEIFWWEENYSFYPSSPGDLANIPIAWATFDNDSWGILIMSMDYALLYSYSGVAVNPYSVKNVGYEFGGSVASLDILSRVGVQILDIMILGNKKNTEGFTGYIYLKGQIALTTFRAYYYSTTYNVVALNKYIAMTSLVNIGISSNGKILIGDKNETTSLLKNLKNYMEYELFKPSPMDRKSNNTFSLDSFYIYPSFPNYGLFLSYAIPLGAMILNSGENTLGIPESVLGSLLGFFGSQIYISEIIDCSLQYTGMPNESIYMYILYPNHGYQIVNQSNVMIPLMVFQVFSKIKD